MKNLCIKVTENAIKNHIYSYHPQSTGSNLTIIYLHLGRESYIVHFSLGCIYLVHLQLAFHGMKCNWHSALKCPSSSPNSRVQISQPKYEIRVKIHKVQISGTNKNFKSKSINTNP